MSELPPLDATCGLKWYGNGDKFFVYCSDRSELFFMSQQFEAMELDYAEVPEYEY